MTRAAYEAGLRAHAVPPSTAEHRADARVAMRRELRAVPGCAACVAYSGPGLPTFALSRAFCCDACADALLELP